MSVGPVRPVDADEASGGPVGEHRRARARTERDRSIGRARVLRQAVADVEAAGRSRPARLADADPRVPDLPAAPIERRSKAREIDDEVGRDRVVATQCLARDPAERVVRQDRQAGLDPQTPTPLDALECEHDVRRALRRTRRETRDDSASERRPRARGDVHVDAHVPRYAVDVAQYEGLATGLRRSTGRSGAENGDLTLGQRRQVDGACTLSAAGSQR